MRGYQHRIERQTEVGLICACGRGVANKSADDVACREPLPLITVTDLSTVEADTTGSVPCRFSLSFKGLRRTTTCTEAAEVDEGGRVGAMVLQFV